jgi:hypothetical protein
MLRDFIKIIELFAGAIKLFSINFDIKLLVTKAIEQLMFFFWKMSFVNLQSFLPPLTSTFTAK